MKRIIVTTTWEMIVVNIIITRRRAQIWLTCTNAMEIMKLFKTKSFSAPWMWTTVHTPAHIYSYCIVQQFIWLLIYLCRFVSTYVLKSVCANMHTSLRVDGNIVRWKTANICDRRKGELSWNLIFGASECWTEAKPADDERSNDESSQQRLRLLTVGNESDRKISKQFCVIKLWLFGITANEQITIRGS